MMDSNARRPGMIRALLISLGVNLLIVLLPICAIGPRTHGVFAGISDKLAAPPGALIKRMFEPREHSTKAFELAAAESILLSFVFYTIIAWLVIKCMPRVISSLRRFGGVP